MLERVRNSLSTKITLFFLLVTMVLLCGSGVYAYRQALSAVTDSYAKTSDIIFYYGANCIEYYVNDHVKGMQELEDFAYQMQSLCQNGEVQMVFIARQNDEDPMKGDIITLVTYSDQGIIGEDSFSYSYTFDSDEQSLLCGEKDDVVIEYISRVGKVYAYCDGLHITNQKTGMTENYIIGVEICVDIFHLSLGKEMLRIFLITAVVLLLLVILLDLYIKNKVVKPLIKLSAAMDGFIQGNKMSFEPLKVEGSDEQARVMQSFNSMAGDIQQYVVSVKEYEADRQKNIAELEIAADIQKGLLPGNEYICAPFILKGYMQQAKNVGGDMYYYERLDETKIAFAIGDVSGKGISAALFMASTVSTIRYHLHYRKSPAKAIGAINNDILKRNPNQLFVTMFVGLLDAKDHTLTYSNAGHNPPYLIGEKPEILGEGKGIFAGIFENEEYEDAHISVKEGDTLFLYTDGVPEAVNGKKEFFGTERMERVLSSGGEDLIRDMVTELKRFTDGAVQFDDITMLTLKFKNDLEEGSR